MDTIKNTSPSRVAGYLTEVTKLYPLLFDPVIAISANGHPSLYLKDKSISHKPFEFREHSFGFVEMVSIIEGNIFNISLDIVMTDSDPSGTFMMRNDLGLSDQACIAFFDYNIIIQYVATTGSGWINIIPYDQKIITRRHTLKNIIKDE